MVIVLVLAGCSQGISLPNEACGLFFKLHYPDRFVLSSDGNRLKLVGSFTIDIDSYRYSGSPDKTVDTTVASLSKSLGREPVSSDFIITGMTARKLSVASGDGQKVAYVFWKDGWIGVVGSTDSLDEKKASLLESIAGSLTLIDMEPQLKTSGKIDLNLFSITIPENWAGSVVNHFELEMTYGSIINGVGKFSVYVAKEMKYKKTEDWAADFSRELGWKPKYGYVSINKVKFLTFKNIDGQMTTRIYSTIRNGNLAVMSYTVSTPEVEKEALDIAKGFRFK
jgi:hypothetical protein